VVIDNVSIRLKFAITFKTVEMAQMRIFHAVHPARTMVAANICVELVQPGPNVSVKRAISCRRMDVAVKISMSARKNFCTLARILASILRGRSFASVMMVTGWMKIPPLASELRVENL